MAGEQTVLCVPLASRCDRKVIRFGARVCIAWIMAEPHRTARKQQHP